MKRNSDPHLKDFWIERRSPRQSLLSCPSHRHETARVAAPSSSPTGDKLLAASHLWLLVDGRIWNAQFSRYLTISYFVSSDFGDLNLHILGSILLCLLRPLRRKQGRREHHTYPLHFHSKRLLPHFWITASGFLFYTSCPVWFEDWFLGGFFHFQAFSVMVLYVRCTAIDPSDRTHQKRKRFKHNTLSRLNYRFLLVQIVLRFIRKMEKKVLRGWLKRNYVDTWTSPVQIEPLLPFPLIDRDGAVSPDLKYEDISFCSFCDLEVRGHALMLF